MSNECERDTFGENAHAAPRDSTAAYRLLKRRRGGLMRTRSVAFALLLGSCTIGDQASTDSTDPADDSRAGIGLSPEDKSEGGEGNSLYARVCASGATTRGIDVSYYEGSIDWPRVHASGIDFAFIRVSDGTGFHDPKFASYWAAAKAEGVIRGPYQFFRPNQDINAQADLLVSAIGGSYTKGDLPPVIDVEATGGLGPSSVAAKVRQWVDRVKSKLGVDPIVYTGKYFWRDQVGGPTSFASNALWIAQYTSLCPDLPAPWNRWTFWQNSESGSVPGISGNVDTDKFNGSLDDLRAFAGGTGTPPPPKQTCSSATLDRDVPDGTCVQAASDGNWYGCSNGMWVSRSSSSGCADAYAWCSSATLGHTVAPRTCVQAASDQVWYQCTGKAWETPVNTSTHTGPAGTCSSSHAL
jgi:GH25 family lysozyme M1 (1,4-beta-N-acetylmuramidase)